jgi:hypothetical protein
MEQKKKVLIKEGKLDKYGRKNDSTPVQRRACNDYPVGKEEGAYRRTAGDHQQQREKQH